MRILAIETSCDETGIAIVETRGKAPFPKSINVLSNALVSQAALHAQFGGVFPSLARREHGKNIIPLLVHALSEAKLAKKLKTPRKLSKSQNSALTKIFHKEPELFAVFQDTLLKLAIPKIDAIAVTAGPGLEPALWVGINTAEGLGALWDIPVIPVNHMEGHIVAALLSEKLKVKSKKSVAHDSSVVPPQLSTFHFTLSTIAYPALALLVSGGHTELVLMPSAGKYKILGQTRDDAVGEAFDKVARMLGLAYPGGPEVSKLAAKAPEHQKLSVPLPRPMLKSDDYDFSFSGLKTSVLYAIKKFESLDDRDRELIAKDFEDSVTEVLIAKTLRAAKQYKVKEIILGGGVTANIKIRTTFQKQVAEKLPGTTLFIPDTVLSGDNGLMIGVAGLLRSKTKKHIVAQGTLRLAKSATKTLEELRKKKKN